MSGNFEPESQILARLIGHDRAAVGGAQDEGFDHAALARYRLDAEIAPAVPASGRRFLLAIDPSLACDQDVGEEPVSLAPGRKNFIGSGVAEHGLDRAEQRLDRKSTRLNSSH